MRLRASMKLRNDVMISARERLGLNQRAMAKLIGVPKSVYMELEKLNYKHFTRMDRARAHAAKIAEFVCATVEEILPPDLEGIAVEADRVVVAEIATEKLLGVGGATRALTMDPCEQASAKEAVEAMHDAWDELMDGMTDRQREVMTMRYGLAGDEAQTVSQVAKALGVTRSRVRQVESSGMGYLRMRLGSRESLTRKTREVLGDWFRDRERLRQRQR